MILPSVQALLSRQMPGYTLTQGLHLDPDVYRVEIERIWRPAWLFAAHSAELRNAGDRTVFDFGDDSVLLVRGEDGSIRAFHNVCRHRGSRLVDATIVTLPGPFGSVAVPTAHAGPAATAGRHDPAAPAGPAATAGPASRPDFARYTGSGRDAFIRCPYHQWAYHLDGSLAACGGMDRTEGFDAAAHGLVQVEIAEVSGLVFVRVEAAPEPGPGGTQPNIHELAEPLLPQGLERAKLAHQESYVVDAGWKVVWENNRECWHCHAGHPEYIRSNFDTANTASPEVRRRMASRTASMISALSGLSAGNVFEGGGLAAFPSPGHAWSSHRTPLAEGFATESLDGAPVAPLMGDYKSYDVGVLRVRALPNFWCHACADHAVTTRLAPAGVEATEVVVTWLVDQDAVEGRDYSLETLLPVWARTSEQDWELCERNQRGIRSSGYRPGPLSPRHEANVAAFHAWYLEEMARPDRPAPANLGPSVDAEGSSTKV